MKKVKIKTEELYQAHMILKAAKYTNMTDADKIKAWKIARAMKPIATKYEEDQTDAANSLKPSDCNFDETYAKVQEFERLLRSGGDMTKSPIGAAEHDAFIKNVWQPYNKLVADAIKPLADAEVEFEIEPLSEEAFGQLMGSNTNWVLDTVSFLGEIITD